MTQDAVAKPKHAGGRPAKYRKEFAETILKLPVREQHSSTIAAHLDVTKSTVNQWALDYPEFSVSLQKCRQNHENYLLSQAYSRVEGTHQGSDTLIKYLLSAMHGYREATVVDSNITADVTTNDKVEITFVDLKP